MKHFIRLNYVSIFYRCHVKTNQEYYQFLFHSKHELSKYKPANYLATLIKLLLWSYVFEISIIFKSLMRWNSSFYPRWLIEYSHIYSRTQTLTIANLQRLMWHATKCYQTMHSILLNKVIGSKKYFNLNIKNKCFLINCATI